jgi:hypothetical protein
MALPGWAGSAWRSISTPLTGHHCAASDRYRYATHRLAQCSRVFSGTDTFCVMVKTIGKRAFLWKSGDWVTVAVPTGERATATAVELDDSHTGTTTGRVMNYHDH